MMYKVFHGSTYTYSGPVESSRHLLHLLPRDHQTQKCLLSSVEVSPRPATNTESLDAFQNRVTFLDVEGPYDQMIITALSEVAVEAPPVLNLSDCPSWEYVSNLFGDLTDNEIREAHQFTRSSPYIMDLESVREFSVSSFPSGRPILDAVMDLTSRIFSNFSYEGGVTDISTPISNVMQSRKGVC
jgi:transglutaminase-like putative cysteine protease